MNDACPICGRSTLNGAFTTINGRDIFFCDFIHLIDHLEKRKRIFDERLAANIALHAKSDRLRVIRKRNVASP